ncbi:MAG: ATP--guanido phosphotransferase [Hungatella sp.]|jgi:protein arginine kinase|nr:ATP--guanido phosphotransferase [Hungatella sp.]
MLKWFEQVQEGGNIVCSKIRLARNLSEYVFPSRLSDEDGRQMLARLQEELEDLGDKDGREYGSAYLDQLSELDKRALKERLILSASLLERKAPMSVLITKEEDISLILNGLDHIRIQVWSPGLRLAESLKIADRLDDHVNSRFSYAFDDRYGYLTSFPTNVGTGLRATAIVHLPTLSMGKKFPSMLNDMGRIGVSIRGVYGEGRENYGSLYEISNQKTMGRTEKELTDLVAKVATQLDDQERQIREMGLASHRPQLEDEVYKSYGVLKYARRLSMKDAMTFLSQIMSGMTDGLVKFDEPCSVFRLMLGIQTANLQKLSDRPLDKGELDGARAAYLRGELPELA